MSAPASLEAGLLRVVFARQGDRYGHSIEVRDFDGVWEPVLTSVEGTSTDDWPPSPPSQELHFEKRPDGQKIALLVGMAGSSHWSASVELRSQHFGSDQRTSEAAVLEFDCACRLKHLPLQLGSTYQTREADGSARTRATPAGQLLVYARGAALSVAAIEATNAASAEWSRIPGNQLSLRLAGVWVEGAATARWRYRIVATPPAE